MKASVMQWKTFVKDNIIFIVLCILNVVINFVYVPA